MSLSGPMEPGTYSRPRRRTVSKKSDNSTQVTEDFVTRRQGEKTHTETFTRKLAEKRADEQERVTAGKSLPSALA
jgi:hypothetical protein